MLVCVLCVCIYRETDRQRVLKISENKCVVDFFERFESIHGGKMVQILLAYDLLKETLTAIMMFYKDTKATIRSPDGNSGFFNIASRVLQGNTLEPSLFIIYQEYIQRTSIDRIKESSFPPRKGKNQKIYFKKL